MIRISIGDEDGRRTIMYLGRTGHLTGACLAVVGLLLGARAARAGQGRGAAAPAAVECKAANQTLDFALGSAAIDDTARSTLDDVAQWVGGDVSRSVSVDGYADRSGGAARNQELSEERAQATKDYLVARGVTAERVHTAGHGDRADRPDREDRRIVAVEACGPPRTNVNIHVFWHPRAKDRPAP
jgi:hypothetical protein